MKRIIFKTKEFGKQESIEHGYDDETLITFGEYDMDELKKMCKVFIAGDFLGLDVDMDEVERLVKYDAK